jgi:sulfate transport system permease protein
MSTRTGRRSTLSVGLATTIVWLALLVLLPIALSVFRVTSMTPAAFLAAAWSDRARAAYFLTFTAAFAAALLDALLGTIIAWVLVRYPLPAKGLWDAIIDLPFALPTAVAGLVYSSIYGPAGWLGRWLYPLGIETAYSRPAIVLVLTFVGLPFVVRTVQPILEELDREQEEAAASLGAGRWETFRRVLFPQMLPAVLTGMALAFARGLGEYGSVVFVSGNLPMRTEIAPVLIVGRLESFEYLEANAIAVVLLAMSFATLAGINLLERWSRRHDD